MNIIDSSLWLEYFADSSEGECISEIIENTNERKGQRMLRMERNEEF